MVPASHRDVLGGGCVAVQKMWEALAGGAPRSSTLDRTDGGGLSCCALAADPALGAGEAALGHPKIYARF